MHNFPKIDAHFHAFSDVEVYLKIAEEYNLHYININTDTTIFPSMEEQESITRKFKEEHPEFFSYITSFSMRNWDTDGWIDKTIRQLKAAWDFGAVGVKIWKNIGMEIRKTDGSFLFVDDPFFNPLFTFLSDNNIPVVAHLGEPRNCWLPLEEMTTRRNRAYYTKNPEFHAYLHPEIPSYEKQIEVRDNLLNLFPDLQLIGAHLGSMEWSVREISRRLDKYPNFAVDLSSRLGHIQLQSQKEYEPVREFFVTYADRIIYGTDAYDNPEKLLESLVKDWQYLATYNMCESYDVAGEFRGLELPEEVLYKIYYENALKYYYRLSDLP